MTVAPGATYELTKEAKGRACTSCTAGANVVGGEARGRGSVLFAAGGG